MSHREVMQQALEAIRIFREWEMGQDYESCRATVLARALAAEESLGAALAEPTCKDDLQVEPVAWMDVDDRGNMLSLRFWSEGGHEEVPLYTHPAPQRQPHEPSREMLEALQIIAAPQRPDGTWNRDREACRHLAAEALGFHNKRDWQ